MKTEVFIRDTDFANRIDFYITFTNDDGVRYLITDLKTSETKIVKDGQIIEPTFSINGTFYKPFLQAMADELYTIGINPSQKPILENELTAVKFHLEDMRKLVFKK